MTASWLRMMRSDHGPVAFAAPALVWDVAIGQSTVATGRVKLTRKGRAKLVVTPTAAGRKAIAGLEQAASRQVAALVRPGERCAVRRAGDLEDVARSGRRVGVEHVVQVQAGGRPFRAEPQDLRHFHVHLRDAVAVERTGLQKGHQDVCASRQIPAERRRGVNLVAIRGPEAPTLWLMAHLDSKSQPVPILARAAGIKALAVARMPGIFHLTNQGATTLRSFPRRNGGATWPANQTTTS